MSSQLRIYSIRTARLDEFTAFWRAEIVPLRRRFGFTVEGAWADAETSTFAWVVGHPEFDEAEAAYYASPDRAALSHDPSEFIEHSDLRRMEPVDPR
ncbi:MAG: hypothetical protein QOF77_1985 [Solirubrobacteraceae bacterium]|jgi:hypothetical protein|nr:hypothetical protein [Solirubrobacteraceae bacterium]